MFSYWAYILVGRNDTGKTSFQRNLVYLLCGVRYSRLACNVQRTIKHPHFPKGIETLSVSNRSYQEKESKYKSVANYFSRHFKEADLCFLSSHSRQDDVTEMIQELRRRYYNVAGVFWSNSDGEREREIAGLSWDEVLWIQNPELTNSAEIDDQLSRISREFSEMLITRAQSQ